MGTTQEQPADSSVPLTLTNCLEKAKRNHAVRNSYDLYHALDEQLQPLPAKTQLTIVCELVLAEKNPTHEVAILMLLHRHPNLRKVMGQLLLKQVNNPAFTSLDVKRLQWLLPWLPEAEQAIVQALLAALEQRKLKPTPSPRVKNTEFYASAFDGSGAQMILFSGKQNNQRILGGFVVKYKVGIHDAWVKTKISKTEIDNMLNSEKAHLKPISAYYFNKITNHFLNTTQDLKRVPPPGFLQVIELIHATHCQAEPLDIDAEIQQLITKGELDLENEIFIEKSLKRSGEWMENESFFEYWFESGELAEQGLRSASNAHQQLRSKKSNDELEQLLTQHVISLVRQKWQLICLCSALRARSKEVLNPLWQDMLVLAYFLSNEDKPLHDIPALGNIAKQTAAAAMGQHRQEGTH